MKPVFITICCLASLALLAPGQKKETGKPETVGAPPHSATVDAAELALELVPVSAGADIHQLTNTLHGLFGRRLRIVMEDGSQRSARNISIYGRSLILQDTPAMIGKIKKTLVLLQQENRSAARDDLVVVEYKTRFISIHDANNALEPLSRRVATSSPGMVGSPGVIRTTGNISCLNERSPLIRRDTQDQVDRMLALLKRLDQPKAQLLISCTLVQGTDGAEEARATKLVPEELRSLSPYRKFHIISTGVLRTTAGPGNKAELSMMGGRGESARISLQPTAWDPNTGTLALANVNVNIQSIKNAVEPANTRQTFSTSTSITRDEFVVLGAFGTNPVFVILKLTEVK